MTGAMTLQGKSAAPLRRWRDPTVAPTENPESEYRRVAGL
jgi:hypothetical protein